MVWPAIIGAVAGLAGLAGGQKSSAKEAQKAREWDLAMSNTKHQREVADLRAAGLNPILSASSGMGGGAPASPVASVPDYGRVGDMAFTAAKQYQETKTSKDQSDLFAGQSSLIEEQRLLLAAQKNSAVANAQHSAALADKTKAEEAAIQATLPGLSEEQRSRISQNNASASLSGSSAKAKDVEAAIGAQELKGLEAQYAKLVKAGDVHATKAGSFLAWLRAITEAAGFHSSASTHIRSR